ncbi:MAG: selenide, water dikinase SelD [Oscillibacter sp.]|nr:selenide, water dikinase SelD [Oscillibacter sp.]
MAENEVKLTKLAKCAGCGAKVGAGVLSQLLEGLQVHRDPNLLVGFDKSDDASVYKVSDELALVQTVDFFPPIADDPYLFGQIAATNALSDVYAMGGEPKLCLNIMAIPESMPREAVHQLLRGGYDKVYEAGAMITGGHSILDDEPKYGLAVTGFVHPDRVLTNSGARPGDVLLFTKPLGIGVLTTAAKADMASPESLDLAHRLMTTLNKSARDAMVDFRVHACTDVTGFGMLGHAYEMAQGSDVEIELSVKEIDFIPEAGELARMGILPEGMYRNRTYAEPGVDAGDTPLWQQDLLYDPQTAGGLLMAVDPADAAALFARLQGSVPSAQRIGVVRPYRGGKRIFLR